MAEARTTTRVDFLLRNCRARIDVPRRRVLVTRPDFQQALLVFDPGWAFRRMTFRKLAPGYGCDFDRVRGREGPGHTVTVEGELERAREADLELLRQDIVWPPSPVDCLEVTHEDGSTARLLEYWVPFEGGCLYLDARRKRAEEETPANIGVARFVGSKMRFLGIVLFASDWAEVGTVFLQARSPFDRMPYNDRGPAVIQPAGDLLWTLYDEVRGEYVRCKSRADWMKRRAEMGLSPTDDPGRPRGRPGQG